MAFTLWNRPLACAVLAGTLLAAVSQAAQPRFARLGAFEGLVEVQLDPAESWRPALSNLPLPESTRIRTGPAAKVEIELDDAGVLRLVGAGLAELSDYTRLSGGQRITVISLDRGLAYFTGEPGAGNLIHLLVPGAQATLKQGSRIRLQALDSSSEIAIIEGASRFSIPAAEMDLRHGQSVRVTIPESSNFQLFREVTPLETDSWSEQLDKAQAQSPASRLDLDRAGKWITAGDYGVVWQPPTQAGWAPFRQGRWLWYQSIGFTWIGAEPWGWKPYHEGRWIQHPDLGWLWQPGPKDADFAPGPVFWARASNMVAWGALAPGEQWNGAGPPRQFAAFNVTGGNFVSGAREIVPSPLDDLPKDLLKAFLFTSALPSPPLPATRLTITRDALRTRLFKSVEVSPALPDVTEAAPPPSQPEPQPVADVPPPAMPSPVPVTTPPTFPDPPPPRPQDHNTLDTGHILVKPPQRPDPPRNRNNNDKNHRPTPNPNTPVTTTSNDKRTPTPPPVVRRDPPPQSRPERPGPKPPEIHRAENPPIPRPVSTPAPPVRTPSTPAPPVKTEAPRSQPAPSVKTETPAAPKADAPAVTIKTTK
jgi:hypothetical protein